MLGRAMTVTPDATQRVLDAAERKGIKLDVVFFDESTRTAEEAARAVGTEVGAIVKSLIFVSEHVDGLEAFLVLASGANQVDVALLGAVLTEPRLRRANASEVRELTGFAIGGIPPFGHKQVLRTIMDPDLGRHEQVWAAAGTPNAVFPIAPQTLRLLSNAVVTSITGGFLPTEAERTASAPTNA